MRLPEIVEHLRSPDEEIRHRTLLELGNLAERAEVSMPALTDQLLKLTDDPVPSVRHEAAKVLGLIGVASPAIVNALRKAMSDSNDEVSLAAILSLISLGAVTEAATKFLPILQNPERDLTATGLILEVLAKVGKSGSIALPAVRSTFNYPLWEVCNFAGLALKGILGVDAIADLIDGLNHYSPAVRECAAEILGDWGSVASGAVASLATVCRNDPNAEVRVQAAFALGQIGLERAESIDALTAASSDPDQRVRGTAAAALSAIQPGNALAIDAMHAALASEDPQVRWKTLRALSRIGGPIPESLLTPLVASLRDRTEDNAVARFASECLGRMGVVAVRPLIESFVLTDLETCYHAISALRLLGPSARAAIPTLLELIERKPLFRGARRVASENWIKYAHVAANAAFIAVGELVEATDSSAVASLVEALASDNELVQKAGVRGLAVIGSYDSQALIALQHLTQDPDSEIANLASEAIAKLQI